MTQSHRSKSRVLMIARLHERKGVIFMRTKKILKIIGIILIILLVLTLIHTIRNYIIIRNLQNKISK